MTDAEMQDTAEVSEPLPPIALDVFQFVKIAQSQHGLKHNDYPRYRQYCKNKLHRSRRHLKLQQGKGKFVRRKLDESQIHSSAHLQVPLVNAEKSWAHAMESKGQVEGDHASKARQNLLRRLKKAAGHATEFSSYAQKRGTTRTALEAEAYAEHLNGVALLEHPTRRASALKHLQKARKLCEQLSKLGSFEQQTAAQQRLDDIEPLVRYAQYQLNQGSQDAPPTPTTPNLGSKFAELRSEEKDESANAGHASGPAYLRWRGTSYPAFGERLKAHITTAEQAAGNIVTSEGIDKELSGLEEVTVALNEAKGIVRHALAGQGGTGADLADALDDQKALNTALSGKQLETVIRRNKLLALQACQALDSKALPQVLEQTKQKGRKRRGQGPTTVVRQYDGLIQNVKELTEVASQLGGAAGEYLLDDCTAMAAEMKAQRCFYVARTYLADQKPREACALFGLAAERSGQAVSAFEDCAQPDSASIQGMEELKALCAAWRVVAHAQTQESEEKFAQAVDDISLEAGNDEVQDKYLIDDLESWTSYAGSEGRPAKIAPIPPRLQLIQAKPFLLDCALDYIQAPDLSQRIPKEEKKSTIGRLFGWGAK